MPLNPKWGFPKCRGTLFGVPIFKTLVSCGWGLLFWETTKYAPRVSC